MRDCIFCSISRGNVPVHTVYEDDDVVAFLDHEPIRDGHLLILTKVHYPYFDDLPGELLSRVCLLGKRLAKIQRRLFGVERAGMMFSGNDIAHCHAHVLPLHSNTDLTSGRYFPESDLTFRRRPHANSKELSRLAAEITVILDNSR